MIPAEEIAVAWLAAGVDAHVGTETPDSIAEPWVLVSLLDEGQITDRIITAGDAWLQFDCYAGTSENTDAKAAELARAVRDRLALMVGTHAHGVISNVGDVHRRQLPDTSERPALQRHIITAVITGRE